MNSHHTDRKPKAGVAQSAFGVLDECHRQTLAALAKLETIVARLEAGATDSETRALAGDVVRHFSTTARQHHADEEQHVFPKLAVSGDPAIEQAVLRLLQDHNWLEEDWMTLRAAPRRDRLRAIVVRRRCPARRLRNLRGALARPHRPRGDLPLSGGARAPASRGAAGDGSRDGRASARGTPLGRRRAGALRVSAGRMSANLRSGRRFVPMVLVRVRLGVSALRMTAGDDSSCYPAMSLTWRKPAARVSP